MAAEENNWERASKLYCDLLQDMVNKVQKMKPLIPDDDAKKDLESQAKKINNAWKVLKDFMQFSPSKKLPKSW
jgi:hypothetical protein